MQHQDTAAGAAVNNQSHNHAQRFQPDAEVQWLWQEAQAAMLECQQPASDTPQHQHPDQAPPELQGDTPSSCTAHSCSSADHSAQHVRPVTSLAQNQQTAQQVNLHRTMSQHQRAASLAKQGSKRQHVQAGDAFGRALQRFGSTAASQGADDGTQRLVSARSMQPMVSETTLNMLQVMIHIKHGMCELQANVIC